MHDIFRALWNGLNNVNRRIIINYNHVCTKKRLTHIKKWDDSHRYDTALSNARKMSITAGSAAITEFTHAQRASGEKVLLSWSHASLKLMN